MDEFDKIREISEYLTHRREPTFTQFGKSPAPSQQQPTQQAPLSGTQSSDGLSHTHDNAQRMNNIHSFLSQPATGATSADSEFNPLHDSPADEIDFSNMDPVHEKPFASMKLHLIGITVFAGILGIALAGFFFWGDEQDSIDEIVTITTAPEIIKELPEQSGGMNIPNQDKLVYNRIRSDNVTTKVESLFPEPEKPVMPQILNIEENSPDTEFVNMDSVKAVNPLDEPAKPKVAPRAESAPAPTSSANTAKEVAEQKAVSAPETPKVAVLPLKQEFSRTKSATKESKQPTIKEAKKAGNVWRVQLFASNNKSAVEKAWKRILKAHNALLSDMSYTIESAQIKGKGTFYRLKVGQFSSRDMAASLCTKLKARKQDCVPTK